MNNKNRILEIDLLRGIAIFLMILHHFIFDLRYVVGLDVFAFQDSLFFQFYVRSAVITVFILVSGVSCQFSRDNLKRGLRLLIASLILSGGSVLVRFISKMDLPVIVFNVFHVLAISILVYAVLEKLLSQNRREKSFAFFISLLLGGVLIIFLPLVLNRIYTVNSTVLNIILFARYPQGTALLDSMALLPWLGFFLIGAALGMALYRRQQSVLPEPGPKLSGLLSPFCFMGRNALWVYLLHQPILLLILWLLSLTGLLPKF